MLKTRKLIGVLLLTSAFLAGAILCCCIRHLIPQEVKSSCCHKGKAEKQSSKHDCQGCTSILKSAETAKVFDLAPTAQINIASQPVSDVVIFKLPVAIKSAFITGPPGPVTVVPAYILSHSLRL